MTSASGVLRSALAVAAVAVLLGAPAAVAAGRIDPVGPGRLGRAAPAPQAAQPAERADAAAAAEARAGIDAALAAQGRSLAAGDVTGYLTAVDQPLRAAATRRFDALRALRAVEYDARSVEPPRRAADRWRATVQVRFCAVVAGCSPAPVRVATAWSVDGGAARLVEYTPSTAGGPRPWETTELRAVIGTRVVVAAPPRHAGRLSATLAVAEQAAARADRYARWRPRPSRYVVYLAGPEEWATWYGVKQPGWAAGFAMPITSEYTEIVLNAGRVGGGEVLNTLVHEFVHVTTLAGVQRNYTDSWLLVEGLAEYVTHAGRSVSSYPWLSGTRRFVRSGQWPGTAGLAAPPESATVGDATGRYGVAYLAVRHLVERFGEEKVLAFFAAVARDGRDPATAALEIFGVAWADAAAGCDRYLRANAG